MASSADLSGADEALAAYLSTRPNGWPDPQGLDAASFFTRAFRPAEPVWGHMTGYYEPELPGSRRPTPRFCHALYARPADLPEGPWFTRAEIEEGGLLKGYEIAWVETALDAFLAQVQGSVRIRYSDGSVQRLGYGGKNGHPYVSIGKELVRQGLVSAETVSVQDIRAWCAANPDKVTDLLRCNPSFGFFRKLDIPSHLGPIGTAGVPLTTMSSVAVDPIFIPLGAPLMVAASGLNDFPRIVVAQDTGSAIKGAGRIDLFCGIGMTAGEMAGRLNQSVEVTVLMPAGVPA